MFAYNFQVLNGSFALMYILLKCQEPFGYLIKERSGSLIKERFGSLIKEPLESLSKAPF